MNQVANIKYLLGLATTAVVPLMDNLDHDRVHDIRTGNTYFLYLKNKRLYSCRKHEVRNTSDKTMRSINKQLIYPNQNFTLFCIHRGTYISKTLIELLEERLIDPLSPEWEYPKKLDLVLFKCIGNIICINVQGTYQVDSPPEWILIKTDSWLCTVLYSKL